jgi:hypothetical protein
MAIRYKNTLHIKRDMNAAEKRKDSVKSMSQTRLDRRVKDLMERIDIS